jgi:hypothetical protein
MCVWALNSLQFLLSLVSAVATVKQNDTSHWYRGMFHGSLLLKDTNMFEIVLPVPQFCAFILKLELVHLKCGN